jgi:hypothetical protein
MVMDGVWAICDLERALVNVWFGKSRHSAEFFALRQILETFSTLTVEAPTL